MRITLEFLKAGGTNGMGWNWDQLKVLGVKSFRKGWLRGLIGQEITEEQARRFLELNGRKKTTGVDELRERVQKAEKKLLRARESLQKVVRNAEAEKETAEPSIPSVRPPIGLGAFKDYFSRDPCRLGGLLRRLRDRGSRGEDLAAEVEDLADRRGDGREAMEILSRCEDLLAVPIDLAFAEAHLDAIR